MRSRTDDTVLLSYATLFIWLYLFKKILQMFILTQQVVLDMKSILCVIKLKIYYNPDSRDHLGGRPSWISHLLPGCGMSTLVIVYLNPFHAQ